MTRTLIIAVLVAGCAGDYIYRPAENATAQIHGRTAARYEIPQQAPQGDVRVASFGIAKVERQDTGEKQRMVHVRMIVANNSQQPWTVDTREVRIELPQVGQETASIVRAQNAQGPIVQVAPMGQEQLDLFYPLPPGIDKASRLPEFSALWTVHTPQQTVTERTPFDRLQVYPTYAYGYGYGPWYGWYGWGGPWHDPWMIGAPVWW
jgi:hypothetical protein